MNGSMVKGLLIGAVVATAGGAVAGYNMIGGKPPAYAEVVAVTQATTEVTTPREVCEEVPVTRQKAPRDEHRVIGTVTGAVIGGVLGNQVGGGNGKKLATVAGAAAGGYAGNQIQKRNQANDTYTTMETRCSTVSETQEKVIGYDVTYRIGEVEGQVQMDHDPGERIPLVNGELAMN
jgi:uncharacterized protein YcfJ